MGKIFIEDTGCTLRSAFEGKLIFSVGYGILGFKVALCDINTNPFPSAPYLSQEEKRIKGFWGEYD